LALGVIAVGVRDNKIRYFKPIFAELSRAAESMGPGQVVHVVNADWKA
jgi:hypothetical protein